MGTATTTIDEGVYITHEGGSPAITITDAESDLAITDAEQFDNVISVGIVVLVFAKNGRFVFDEIF
ncbi:MAG: hypothetical protein L0H70_00095 [Xanthomonadales bacterium]|nr:hypothetical protein [Xanthomonadales bacterium]